MKGVKPDEDASLHKQRPDLLCFLNGTKKDQLELKKSKPGIYEYFESVWAVRERHMVKGLPSQYAFMLVTCNNIKCIHPLCQHGGREIQHTWFETGPPISVFPLPVKDPERPWGGQCQECDGICSGHYLKPQDTVRLISEKGISVCDSLPPSVVFKEKFNRITKAGEATISDEVIACLVMKTMLDVKEVRMWIDHLKMVQERRKEGARKATETQRKKKGKSNTLCSIYFYFRTSNNPILFYLIK